ncbi:unnamed protein product [Prorocentrum cordatum]|uniref:Uncharacterized protein n=1 Tax=Prorocentrum cordatum TaxID=2364126 RepID=A0ABN9XU91_9DINO|nr:unnamed protein product [Polarella glacialis]
MPRGVFSGLLAADAGAATGGAGGAEEARAGVAAGGTGGAGGGGAEGSAAAGGGGPAAADERSWDCPCPGAREAHLWSYAPGSGLPTLRCPCREMGAKESSLGLPGLAGPAPPLRRARAAGRLPRPRSRPEGASFL